jgi:hypothetical protein
VEIFASLQNAFILPDDVCASLIDDLSHFIAMAIEKFGTDVPEAPDLGPVPLEIPHSCFALLPPDVIFGRCK